MSQVNPGSFRDPINQVYEFGLGKGKSTNIRILRGLTSDAFAVYQQLAVEPFFQRLVDSGSIIKTTIVDVDDAEAKTVFADGWAGVLEHDVVPFITYPYEWTFSMLKDAALLQLGLLENSIENGWILKDASPYNIQWMGSRPLFIDVPSFEPLVEGEPWVGYRQFCALFLIPLMLRAHLGIDQQPLLRSCIDGISPVEARKFFTGLKRLKKGVLSHIIFPAMVESSIAKRERDNTPARKRESAKQTKAMLLGLVQSLTRLVIKLSNKNDHTDWSRYDKTHTYEDVDFKAKQAFVDRHLTGKNYGHAWDVGCNTGTFSLISSKHCDYTIAFDGDHNAVEQLYLSQKAINGSGILSLVLNVANLSPGQGWSGVERQAFDQRRKPDVIICLALIHHIRISANIPNILFLKWLRSHDADVVLEFVNREDEMVVKLLTNKKEQYVDYNLEQFVHQVEKMFVIEDREFLKSGKRILFFLSPK